VEVFLFLKIHLNLNNQERFFQIEEDNFLRTEEPNQDYVKSKANDIIILGITS
jgi:hypothetical protein